MLMLFVGSAVSAQTKADIRADAHIDRQSVPLSGHLIVTFTVQGPKSLEIEKIKTPVASPVWEAKTLGPEITPLPDGRVAWRQSFRLEPLQAGKVALPLAPIRYRLDQGPWQEHTWKDQTIDVTTDVLDPRVEELRGNSRVEELPIAPGWGSWPMYMAAILLAVSALGLVAWRRSRRRDGGSVTLPPDQWALHELDRIDGQGLPQSGAVERYHTLLSDVLRRYVEVRHRLPASQQTTAEFLASAHGSPHLSAEAQELLREFLQRCDLAKFARADYGVEECQSTASLARRFLGQGEPKPPV